MTAKILGLFSSMALAALMGSASQAHANPPDPPQEAIDACANLKDGAACTLSFHGHTMQGTCGKGPGGNETLACMPPPPPEAIEACANLTADATCTVSHHGRDMEGKCKTPPSGSGQLACMPPHPPRN
jgi:hypothetical protein